MGSSIKNGVHTGIVAIADIKPDRLETLKTTLKGLYERQDDPTYDNPLSRVGTIHFALWSIIDDGKRLLFSSNFDDELEAYLLDFARNAPQGLDAVFSNCVGYPEGGAAADFEGFKKFAEEHLVDCQHYYNAYPMESVNNVKNALKVRDSFIEIQKIIGA
ncbi:MULTISPECIES: hypothetical protein [Nostoc]|uniref:Uncharacterized protein n=2 Tax=Nostoc TaxID=1177 RepID=A0ABR8IKC1_9NOSO|nr:MULTISPECIES: hypothetical protein [Nostoc]MBD2564848.1 hypothetical protein [Nostoc linckia FACHB-391]MBD2651387.1 hypothetical protein [Nostoc foliaceum FACHB-393]